MKYRDLHQKYMRKKEQEELDMLAEKPQYLLEEVLLMDLKAKIITKKEKLIKVKKKIAYQGRPGAYSHLVCLKAFPDYQPVPCESFEEVFKKTENKETEISLIPIENSQAGRVDDIHNLLPMSKLVITG